MVIMNPFWSFDADFVMVINVILNEFICFMMLQLYKIKILFV